MKYRFDSIEKIHTTQDMRVLVISGDHNIFIDYIMNNIKNTVGSLENTLNTEEDDEFNTLGERESTLDYDTFTRVCNSISPMGKWVCKVNWDITNKKNRDRIKAYIKNPSQHALLIVTVSEYKNIRELKSYRALDGSKYSHYIDIQYPRKFQLEPLVKEMFIKKGMNITEDCVKLFILKMGTAYDEYYNNMDTIRDRLGVTNKLAELNKDIDETKGDEPYTFINVNITDFKQAMQGIDYFVIEDFLLQLLVPMHSGKIVKRRRLYKILDTLLGDFTAREICTKLRFKVEELLMYRAYINRGLIPVRTRYNADKIKDRLPENSKLRNAATLTFKKNAYVASLTSIKDWFYIDCLLNRNSNSDSDEKFLSTLMTIMGRTVISNDRLMNDIKVKNTLDEGLFTVNSVFLSKAWRQLKSTKGETHENSIEVQETVTD